MGKKRIGQEEKEPRRRPRSALKAKQRGGGGAPPPSALPARAPPARGEVGGVPPRTAVVDLRRVHCVPRRGVPLLPPPSPQVVDLTAGPSEEDAREGGARGGREARELGIAWATDAAAACHAAVRRGVNGGYVARCEAPGAPHVDARCSGVTERLRACIMPFLPTPDAPPEEVGRAVAYGRSGSSAELGRRVDEEVRHIATCCRAAGVEVEKAARAGAALPFARSAGPSAACERCGAPAPPHVRGRPRYHKWTLAYLADLHRLGMRIVASQVPVAYPPNRVATEIDDLVVTREGRLAVVERKSGYENCVAAPRMQRVNTVLLRGRTAEAELPNSVHSLHALQCSVSADMLALTAGVPRRAVERWVVYVSGASRAKTTIPEIPDLECVWRRVPPDVVACSLDVLAAL